MKTKKVYVVGENRDEEACLMMYKVSMTEEQLRLGKHYKVASALAEKDGITPKYGFDEDEPAGKMIGLSDVQATAIKCAYADLQGSLQAFEQMDMLTHDWDAHKASIEELGANFPFLTENPLSNYEVFVKIRQVCPTEQLDADDRLSVQTTNPGDEVTGFLGAFVLSKSMNMEATTARILDAFHNRVPIAILDNYEYEVAFRNKGTDAH